jgi:hypothetical protein
MRGTTRAATRAAGGRPPPGDHDHRSQPSDESPREYERLATAAVVIRAYHGHLLSLFRAAALLHSPDEPGLSSKSTPEQFMTDVVAYFAEVRSATAAAKFEMLFTFVRDSLSEFRDDPYFRSRPLDAAQLDHVLEVYTMGVEMLASARVGLRDSVALLHNESPLEDSLRLDPRFLAGYPIPVMRHWFGVLSALQSVLGDFLADMDRDVADIGCQHEDPPVARRSGS